LHCQRAQAITKGNTGKGVYESTRCHDEGSQILRARYEFGRSNGVDVERRLPVIDDGKLAGIITDRDICIALGTRNRQASEIQAGYVATRTVQTCAADADVHSAMAAMRRAKVRRMPVVDDGELKGILALNDIVEAVDRKDGDIDYEEVLNTMKAICEHRREKHSVAAAPTSKPRTPAAVA
jgi:CBS domain-containing protein